MVERWPWSREESVSWRMPGRLEGELLSWDKVLAVEIKSAADATMNESTRKGRAFEKATRVARGSCRAFGLVTTIAKKLGRSLALPRASRRHVSLFFITVRRWEGSGNSAR